MASEQKSPEMSASAKWEPARIGLIVKGVVFAERSGVITPDEHGPVVTGSNSA